MTVDVRLPKIEYLGDGQTVNFSTGFPFLREGDLTVLLLDASGTDTTQLLHVDYSVTGAGQQSGGTVIFMAPPQADERVLIERRSEIRQDVALEDGKAVPSDRLTMALDRLTMIAQEQALISKRTVRTPLGEDGIILPRVAERAGKLPLFGPSGEILVADAVGGATITMNITQGGATLNSLAELLALPTASLSPGAEMRVIDEQGGGDTFVYHPGGTETPDLGIIFPANGAGIWERILAARVITPQMFGAVGDGVTDDSGAFLAAGLAAIARGRPLNLLGAQYTYLLTPPINFGAVISHFLIEGEGANILTTNNTATALDFGTSSPNIGVDTVRITNVNFDTDIDGNGGRYIRFQGAAFVRIEGCNFRHCGNGAVTYGLGTQDCTVDGCQFRDVVSPNVPAGQLIRRAVWCLGADTSSYIANRSATGNFHDYRTLEALPPPADDDGPPTRILVRDSQFHDQDYCVYMINAQGCEVVDCYLQGTQRGIAVNNHSTATVRGGLIEHGDDSGTGILVADTSRALIDGVRFKGNYGGGRAVYITQVSKATVQNCEFRCQGTQNVQVNGNSQYWIKNNLFDPPDKVNGHNIRISTSDQGILDTIDNAYGADCDVVAGGIIEGNLCKGRHIGVLIEQIVVPSNGNVAETQENVIKNNDFYDRLLATTGGTAKIVLDQKDASRPIRVVDENNHSVDGYKANDQVFNRLTSVGLEGNLVRNEGHLASFLVTTNGSGGATVEREWGARFFLSAQINLINGSWAVRLSPRTGIITETAGGVPQILGCWGVPSPTSQIARVDVFTVTGSDTLVRLYDWAGLELNTNSTASQFRVLLGFDRGY